LTNAATVGDTITTISFYVSSVLNAIQQYNGSSTNQTLTTPTLTTPTLTGTSTFAGGVANAYGFGVGTAVPSSGSGISFPATQSASSDVNTLDDYEEGSWTPSVGGTATYTASNIGTYVKVGSLVTVFGIININVLGTGSATVVSGLPFSTTQNSQGSIGYFASLASSVVFIQPYVDTNNPTLVQFRTLATAGTGMGNANVFGNSTRIDFTMTYKAA
jgi:hypothetical protein